MPADEQLGADVQPPRKLERKSFASLMTTWPLWNGDSPRMKNESKSDWLVGTWRYSKAVSPMLFTIAKTARGFRIQAVDESDGEELLVSRIRWNGRALTFQTLTPSNNWRTRNRLTAVSKTKALHELTFWEDWEKVPEPVQPLRKKKTIK